MGIDLKDILLVDPTFDVNSRLWGDDGAGEARPSVFESGGSAVLGYWATTDITWSGSNTFSGVVDLSAATVTYPGGTEEFSAADSAKLDGIEAGADVTDAVNVEAAGALMDSEVDADIKTLSLPASTTISAFGATLVDDADAATARATLGLAIGTDVQAWDADLDAIAALSSADSNFIVGSATGWVVESGTTARTSLGLGALAVLGSVNNDNWSGADLAIANGGTGSSTASDARAALGLAIGSAVQAWDVDLDEIAALTKTNNNFIVGSGLAWVTRSGSDARDSLDLGTSASPQFTALELGHATDTTIARSSAGNVTIEGNLVYRAGGTDVPVTDGGTGASTASGARTNLGLAIGSNVQAWDADLDAIAALAKTDGNIIVGNGTAWVAESGSTARTSLELGTGDSPTFASLTLDRATNPILSIYETASTDYNLNFVNPGFQGRINYDAPNGSQLDINPKPADGTSAALFRFFRDTNTTGEVSMSFLRGNASTTTVHKIRTDGGDSTLSNNWAFDTDTLYVDGTNHNVLIGGTTSPASAVNALAIHNGTVPTGGVTNGIILYSQDVSASAELKVRDEASNITTLSPHNFSKIPSGASEDMAWGYYSEKNGRYVNVDIMKVIRLVENLSGEKLIHEGEVDGD